MGTVTRVSRTEPVPSTSSSVWAFLLERWHSREGLGLANHFPGLITQHHLVYAHHSKKRLILSS